MSQAGVIIGVIQNIRLAVDVVEPLLLGGKARCLDGVFLVAAAALALVMGQLGVGRPHDAIALVPHPEAEVHIVEGHGKLLVQPLHLVPHAGPDQQAGTREQDALYGTMIASANDGANLLAEYFGGGTIEGGVAAMNAQVAALGLQHTHFANPHGISGNDHYTSCYDMAQILRWALTQPGFETIFTRLEMYTMAPTNVQPVTRYFSQQDKMRLSYSRYYIPAIRGSKIGYTNIARYSYVCLAEQNGVRLICVTMQSETKPDKYNDVRTLLDYAFARYTGYTDLPSQGLTGEVEVVGGGGTLGKVLSLIHI